LIISLPPAWPDPKWWGRCAEATGIERAAEGGDVPGRGGRRCREQQHMVGSARVAVKHEVSDVQRGVAHRATPAEACGARLCWEQTSARSP